jgi:hypothetical protein
MGPRATVVLRPVARDREGRLMLDPILLHAGAALVTLWGIAHLVPTRFVVAGFGDISLDNRRIIAMEWITEGVALIAVGAFVSAVTIADRVSPAAKAAYVVAAATLLSLAVVSWFTGFRIRFLPFRLCPVVFTTSAVLIMLGGLA